MPKPPKKKRSESGGAGARIAASQEALRRAVLAYAEVANLAPSDRRWRRRWRALRLAALGMFADLVEAATQDRRRRASRRSRSAVVSA